MATRLHHTYWSGDVKTGEIFGSFKFPASVTITKCRMTARTAPTTSNLTLSIRKASVEATTATLTAASTTEETDIADTAFTTSDLLDFQWTAVDSGDTAEGVNIWITYTD